MPPKRKPVVKQEVGLTFAELQNIAPVRRIIETATTSFGSRLACAFEQAAQSYQENWTDTQNELGDIISFPSTIGNYKFPKDVEAKVAGYKSREQRSPTLSRTARSTAQSRITLVATNTAVMSEHQIVVEERILLEAEQRIDMHQPERMEIDMDIEMESPPRRQIHTRTPTSRRIPSEDAITKTATRLQQMSLSRAAQSPRIAQPATPRLRPVASKIVQRALDFDSNGIQDGSSENDNKKKTIESKTKHAEELRQKVLEDKMRKCKEDEERRKLVKQRKDEQDRLAREKAEEKRRKDEEKAEAVRRANLAKSPSRNAKAEILKTAGRTPNSKAVRSVLGEARLEGTPGRPPAKYVRVDQLQSNARTPTVSQSPSRELQRPMRREKPVNEFTVFPKEMKQQSTKPVLKAKRSHTAKADDLRMKKEREEQALRLQMEQEAYLMAEAEQRRLAEEAERKRKKEEDDRLVEEEKKRAEEEELKERKKLERLEREYQLERERNEKEAQRKEEERKEKKKQERLAREGQLEKERAEKEVQRKEAERMKKEKEKEEAELQERLKKEERQKAINEKIAKATPTEYNMTPPRVFVAKSNVDYGLDDLHSDDETDQEDDPRKAVPAWAEFPTVRRHVREQIANPPFDVNAFFGTYQKPDLKAIFGDTVRMKKRGSSAVWRSPAINSCSAQAASLRGIQE